MPVQRTTFEINVAKGENAHNELFLEFDTLISTLLNNHTIIYGDFLYFTIDNFKVVCFRFSLCWNGLITETKFTYYN